jgi:hypothetical protein
VDLGDALGFGQGFAFGLAPEDCLETFSGMLTTQRDDTEPEEKMSERFVVFVFLIKTCLMTF